MEFVKPFSLMPNPRSKTIIRNFIDSNLREAEVDTSWSKNPRRVYEKLHKYVAANKYLGVSVMLRGEVVVLAREFEVDV